MANAKAWFNIALRPWKPEGLLGRTAQYGHLNSHAAPGLSKFWDGTFFLLITAAVPLEINNESSSEEVSYARFFNSDSFSQLNLK